MQNTLIKHDSLDHQNVALCSIFSLFFFISIFLFILPNCIFIPLKKSENGENIEKINTKGIFNLLQ